MGRFILVTGGARSGKSSFAESLVKECGNENDVLYIATSIPFDEEIEKKGRKNIKSEGLPAGQPLKLTETLI